ncbi:MAG: helix-turn-helix domain-containing protein [Actinomycetota bacterium]|nr:helix-turn-helix domain-containing protein [Actinomycetota bacterium]
MSTEPTVDSTAPVTGHGGRRELTDAREIRALAHPVRMGLLEALRREGTLTATEAAELLDESPANCSFHLRTLAKYGFVEEAPGGTGRQRPWRRASRGLSYALDNPEAEVSAAAHELSKHFRDRLLQQQQNWEATWSSYEKPWRDAAFTFHGTSFLTADELTQVNAELIAIFDRYADRLDAPDNRPAGAYPVSVMASGHPLPLSKWGH